MQTKMSCPHCGSPDLIIDLGDTTDFGPLEVDDEHRLREMQTARQQYIGQSVMAAVVHHTLFAGCPAINSGLENCDAHSPMGYQCTLESGHDEMVHQYQVHDDETDTLRTVAAWPNLQAVR